MTPQEIDKLEAGPQLSALIANDIMECNVLKYADEDWPEYRCGCPGALGDRLKPHEDALGGIKPYSTSIDAAWLVVEKTGLLRSNVLIAKMMDTWAVYPLILDATGALTFDVCHPLADSPSITLTLCRAALKAQAQEGVGQ